MRIDHYLSGMKKILSLVLAATLLASCAGVSTSEKLTRFVDKAEEKADGYSAEEWSQSLEEYEGLLQDYLKSGSECSEEEAKEATQAIGRYTGLLMKHGIEKSADLVSRLGTLLPSYLEGLASELNADSLDVESLFGIDEEALEKSADDLGKALEGLFGQPEE